MDKFIIKPSIEPTNDYDKAKNDLLIAYQSFDKLSLDEKKRLANELTKLPFISDLIDILINSR